MKFRGFLFFCSVFLPLTGLAQDMGWLKEKVMSADSVLLISHESTEGITIVDSSGRKKPHPGLLINGRLNDEIIKERQLITGQYRDSLSRILTRPFEDKRIEAGKCFMPHHAIFLFKEKGVSYLDICFGCRSFSTSKDLAKLTLFDNRKWEELRSFFLGVGFRYELE